MNLSTRLKQARDEAGLSQTELAKQAGCGQSVIGNLEAGSQTSSKHIPSIADALGVSPVWLATGRGEMRPGAGTRLALPVPREPHEPGPEFAPVRRVRFKLSAGVSGFSIDIDGDEGDPVFFRRNWLAAKGYKPETLLGVLVAGDSMMPSLYDGDLVIVNTADTTPKDGEVFAINYEGEMVIKRMRRAGGEWWLDSDNGDQNRYRPRPCGEGCYVLGRVVYKQSDRI